MATPKKHIESLDEIVFADRNKEYGAYVIRHYYKKYVTRSFLVSFTALLIAVAVPLIASYYNQNRFIREDKTVGAEFAEMNKPPEEAPPPPPPPPPEALEQKVKFTAPVVTTDSVVETNVLNQDDLASKVTNVAIDENDFNVQETVEEKVIEQEDKTPIFTVVEEMPSFPGGEESRLKYLQDNIQYPQVAKESGISGTVYVSFVVDSKGKVTDVKTLRGIGGGCDEEAVRVIKLMPMWNPGKQAGKSVRVQFTMPIRFTLN
jgi:protein TonB